MAVRRPLVVIGGEVQELPLADTLPSAGGSGISGTVAVNFGAAPGTNIASTLVTGLSSITANSNIKLWVQGSDSTAQHNAYEHMLAPLRLSASDITPGTGFRLNVITDWRLTGTFNIRYEVT